MYICIAEVCLSEQCSHGASCHITVSGSRFEPHCSCGNLGQPERLPVTHACKLATDGNGETHKLANLQVARQFACNAQSLLTFQDVCQGLS